MILWYLFLTLFLNLSQAQNYSQIIPVEHYTGAVLEGKMLNQLKKQEILLNKQEVISYVSPKDEDQDLQDLLDKYPDVGVLIKNKNGTKHFAGHQEGSFNKITKLKNGDEIDVSDELGLITSYTVTRVEDFKLTSLGRGGVPKNNKDSKRLVDVLNSKDSVILQTCTYVTEKGYDVRFVVTEKNKN